MHLDHDRCYAAVHSRDARLDGWFVTAVTSTGIYCRPSCPARTPRADRVRFFGSAAAAVEAGFRACRRCRPDATPGSPDWDVRADLVGRALRLIADGVVDREGVEGLARRLGYTSRHVHRQLVAEVGAGPQALARAQRATTARTLLETTDLPATQIAFAAGFASVRQFNDTLRAVFATTPTDLRRRVPRPTRGRGAAGVPGALVLRLPARLPHDAAATLAFLRARAVPGIDEPLDDDGAGGTPATPGGAGGTPATPGGLRRSLALPHGDGVVELRPGARGAVEARLLLDDLRDLQAAVQRCRRLLDLDADPVAVAEHLRRDPLLGRLVDAAPGRRVAGAVDGTELAVRALLGQQVSVAGARTLVGRLVAATGRALRTPVGTVTHAFGPSGAIADADLSALGVPASRREALRELAQALASGELVLDAGADRTAASARLLAVRGVGPWTAGYIAMRALGDPDAWPTADLVLRRAVGASSAADERRATDAWRPWRAYAAVHLWAAAAAANDQPDRSAA